MKRFHIHPHNPQMRLIVQVVEMLNQGQLIVYPTDATYALGCRIEALQALECLRALRKLDKHHEFTLVCKDLSDLAHYAQVDNRTFRFLKKNTPGPYTFILPGSRELPRRLSSKRKTIGLRIPEHPVTQALLHALAGPLLSSTAQLPGEDLPLTDPDIIMKQLGNQVDALIDAGVGGLEPTTIIDLTGEEPQILREGAGKQNVSY